MASPQLLAWLAACAGAEGTEAPPPEAGTTEQPPPEEGAGTTEVQPPEEGAGTTEAPPPEAGTTEQPPPEEGTGSTEAPPPEEGTTEQPAEGTGTEQPVCGIYCECSWHPCVHGDAGTPCLAAAHCLSSCTTFSLHVCLSLPPSAAVAACYGQAAPIVLGPDCNGLSSISELTPDGACCTALKGLGGDCLSAIFADPSPPQGVTPSDM